jgi:hypothetical protein
VKNFSQLPKIVDSSGFIPICNKFPPLKFALCLQLNETVTERRMTEGRKTLRRMTERRMTEGRMTEGRKWPNVE